MNGHSISAQQLAQLQAKGMTAPADPRLQRVKHIVVDVGFVVGLLQMDGSTIVTMTGWPEGCEVLGATIGQGRTSEGQVIAQLILLVYHPSFPSILLAGQKPERVGLTANLKPVGPPPGTPEAEEQVPLAEQMERDRQEHLG